MGVIDVVSNNFYEEIAQERKIVILDCWAPWCGPCKLQMKVLENFADIYEGIKIARVNIEKETKLMEQFFILSIPTIFIIKDGIVLIKSVGVHSEQQLLEMIELAKHIEIEEEKPKEKEEKTEKEE